MNAAAAYSKLVVKLSDTALTALLIRGGFTNPRQIRNAEDEDLLAISGIGQSKLEQIRAVFPKG